MVQLAREKRGLPWKPSHRFWKEKAVDCRHATGPARKKSDVLARREGEKKRKKKKKGNKGSISSQSSKKKGTRY